MGKKSSSKPKKRQSRGKSVASSNWLDLQKALGSQKPVSHRKKRQKLDSGNKDIPPSPSPSPEPIPSISLPPVPEHLGSNTSQGGGDANDNSRKSLLSMIMALGERFSDEQRLPGRYLALDCEMVGVGIDASESSLARVSLVNYHGVVIMDEYVKQRERVVDYRTRWSGIRASNMINAKPFEEVQKTVDDLLNGRILIGHAVYNDLKVLLLSHPTRQTRDTQLYAYKFALSKSRHISLKNLAKQELGIDIQTGEHSSVVDARVTMAIYRLHKKDWERASGNISQSETAKRKWGMNGLPTSSFPGGGRKGVSSGLSTVIRRGERAAAVGDVDEPPKNKAWWKLLPSGSAGG